MASSSSPSPLVSSSDTASAPLPPLRSSRAHCWEARDAFFGCLDRNNIVDSIRDKAGADEKCGMEEKKLRGECVASWVTYFKQRRVMEFQKKQTLERLKTEGARPMPEGVGPPGVGPPGVGPLPGVGKSA